ncbi:MAG: hypothetical protein WCF44_21580 [Candidatus Methylophosphatis roskildensis]
MSEAGEELTRAREHGDRDNVLLGPHGREQLGCLARLFKLKRCGDVGGYNLSNHREAFDHRIRERPYLKHDYRDRDRGQGARDRSPHEVSQLYADRNTGAA